MNTKYPGLIAIVAIMASITKIFAQSGETFIQKSTAFLGLFPQILAAIPLTAGLPIELTQIKGNITDEEALAEQFVNDLSFSSDKAKAIIADAYPVAEAIAGLVGPAQKLIATIRA